MLAYVIMFYSHVIDKSSNILHNEEGRELSGVILVQLWLAIILSVSIYHENINNLLLYEWFIIMSGVAVPLFCTFFLYGNIDQSTLPDNCKGILQRWVT
ncbi:transmembrane protein 220-like [Clytia hemisphaerica]|uniref:transmembrane protein 220-like n=1 Tax=Clytia hemisphaerica TaxID=252671 RepID=UPI0034D6E213